MKKNVKNISKVFMVLVICIVGILCISSKAQAAKITVAQVKNLKVKSITETSGKLYWSKVKKATGYTIYEYDRAKKKYSKKIGSTKKTSYTVKKLKTGTNHLYKVTAYRKSGKKTYKGKASGKVRLVTKPKKVTTLKKSTIRKNYIKLKWSKTSGADGYDVYKYNNTTRKYNKVGRTTKLEYTVNGLTDATKYQFVVKSYAAADKTYSYAGNSNVVATFTKPNIVTNLYQTEAKSQNSITFTWTRARVAAAYRVYRYDVAKKDWNFLREVSNATTSYTDKNLAAGTAYKYCVRSIIKDENKKNLFDWEYIERDMITTPAAVGALVVNASGTTDKSIPLTWSAVAGASGYYVERYNESTKAYARVGKSTSTSYTDSGLTGYTTYTYRVIPYKVYSVNNKEYASLATAKTVSAMTKLGTPANLRVTNKTDNSVEVSWDKVAKATGYNVYIYEEGKLIKEDKTADTKYVYSIEEDGVIGVNIKIEAYYSEAVISNPGNVTGTTGTTGTTSQNKSVVGAAASINASNIVDKVTGLTRSAYSTSTIGLTWTKQQGTIKYEIFLKTTQGYTKVGETTNNNYLISGLAAGTYYSYVVRAVETYQGRTLYGEYSDAKTFLTMHNALKATVKQSTLKNIVVSWDKAPNADYYQLFRMDGSSNTYKHIATTTSGVVTYTDSSVTRGVKYSYKVRAYTKYDNLEYYGTFSNIVARRLQGQYGIDVSKWQGDINWKKVKAAGVDYAIIRVGYGGSSFTLDSRFKENITEAYAAGIEVGVYIYSYADTVNEAIMEAKATINQIKPYNLTYPVYFDVEEKPILNKLSKAELTSITKAFCNTIRNAGYVPGVYSSASYFESELNYSELTQYEIWVARYVKSDVFYYPSGLAAINNCISLTYKHGGDYKSINAGMWQYTSNGRIDGISYPVDMNYTYKIY